MNGFRLLRFYLVLVGIPAFGVRGQEAVGDPSSEAIESSVAAIFEQAKTDFMNGLFQSAEEKYSYIVAEFPDHPLAPAAALGIATVRLNSGDREGAEVAFLETAEAYSETDESAEANMRLGFLSASKKEKDRAKAFFREAVRLRPQTRWAAESSFRVGMLELSQITETSNLLEIQDRKNAAAEAFMWVIQNHPDQPDIAAEAYVHYAAIFFEWGMEGSLSMDDVREVCGDVIGLFPNGSDRTKALAQLMISETYLNDNRPEIAVVEAAKVSAFYPLESTPAAFSHWIRGQAFERLSNYDGAIAAYKAVMDGSYTENDNFKNRNIHRMCAYRMAHCFRMMGDYDSAHQWYEFVISSWPDSPVSRTARRVLWSMPPRR